MGIAKIEIWVHDHVLKNDKIRHALYGAYQRAIYFASPKIKAEGKITCITPKDGYEYLFGYYDKCPWSNDGNYILALRVKDASKKADSTELAEITRINVKTKDIETLAKTHTWNVQQGCMAQWLSDDEIIFNDYRNKKYCSVVLNIKNKTERIIDMPIYALSPDKKTALTLDFSRLHRLRPGYGYANSPEITKSEKCPNTTCIWKINIKTGHIEPLLKYTDFASFEPKKNMHAAEHKVNHIMISPDGKRFMVLHRWLGGGKKCTRLVTCDIDGKNMYNLSDDDFVSHCCWKNNDEILAYLNKKDGGKGYYLLKDGTQDYSRLWSSLAVDGHPTYSCDGKYVVTDTYPDRKRIQSLYVIDKSSIHRIARVFSPFKYGLDTRCDLHPRWNRDNSEICIDASFDGKRSICIVETGIISENVEVDRKHCNDDPIVSIIMPCCNAEKYLSETISSLEAQTNKDFEVICINDGSIDNTEKILEKWKNDTELNVKIIKQKNSGVSVSRNKGIKEAKGSIILFLDSDDIYNKHYVECMIEASKEADIVYCRLSRKIEEVDSAQYEGQAAIKQSIDIAMNKLLYEMGKYGFYCYAYKKELIDKYKLRFDDNTKFGEDREFVWKYICHCKDAIWIDRPLYGYRINEYSATQKSASWQKTDLLYAVKRTEKYLESEKCEFSDTFKSYMYARSMWAVAKTFAINGNYRLYERLRREFDVRANMRIMMRDRNKLVRLTSVAYMVSPKLYYKLVRLKR